MCYTNYVFEEVGSLENMQRRRWFPAQLTPSNALAAFRQLLTVADRNPLAWGSGNSKE